MKVIKGKFGESNEKEAEVLNVAETLRKLATVFEEEPHMNFPDVVDFIFTVSDKSGATTSLTSILNPAELVYRLETMKMFAIHQTEGFSDGNV